MSLRVAVTRPAPENARTVARLRERGHVAFLAPLLDIEPRPFEPTIDGVQALLFTSSSGVRAFASHSPARAVPVLAVGDATARAARERGFAHVSSADGDVATLAALTTRTLDPSAGKLLHVAGAHVAGDLAATLRSAGFTVERRIAYEAVAAAEIPLAFNDPLDVVLFHSARTASIFVSLGAPSSERLAALCLSDAVAEAARKTAWKQLIVAATPREDALLTVLAAM